jgi:hypothetical protein
MLALLTPVAVVGDALAAGRTKSGQAERMRPQPLKRRPRVSVVVPCYNYGRYLPAAIDSALDQPDVDIEVIVADNGSTDDSLEIARKLARSDPRIRIRTQPTNINFVANFNDGLDLVTGKYTVLLNADDLLTPGSITRAVAVLESRPDVAFAYGDCPAFNEIPPKVRSVARSWSIWDGTEWTRSIYRSGRNVIRNPEVVMRTSVLEEIGGYNADHPHASDLLMWLQAAARGNVAKINGCDQGLFRVHGSNLHTRMPEGWLTDIKNKQAIFEEFATLDPKANIGTADIHAARVALAARAARFACAAMDSPDTKQQRLGRAYACHALKTWPGIKQTRQWRRVEERMQGAVPHWRTNALNAYRSVRAIVGGAINRKLRRW